MQEALLFFDEAAERAIDAIAQFAVERGLAITHRSRYSVSFGGADGSDSAGPRASVDAAPGDARVGAGSLGEGLLPAGAGQAAAVPVQLKPEWCRVWLLVNGGAAAECADALIARERKRSRRAEAEIKRLEASIYDDSQWGAYEARLRAGMAQKGLPAAEVEAKLASFKKVWQGLSRKAAIAPPEQPPAV